MNAKTRNLIAGIPVMAIVVCTLIFSAIVGYGILNDIQFKRAKSVLESYQFVVLESKRQALDDKIFELDLKKSLGLATPVDDAMRDRYSVRMHFVIEQQHALSNNRGELQ